MLDCESSDYAKWPAVFLAGILNSQCQRKKLGHRPSASRRNHCCCSTSPDVNAGGWVLAFASAIPRKAAIEEIVSASRMSARRTFSNTGAARFQASTDFCMSARCNAVIWTVWQLSSPWASNLYLPHRESDGLYGAPQRRRIVRGSRICQQPILCHGVLAAGRNVAGRISKTPNHPFSLLRTLTAGKETLNKSGGANRTAWWYLQERD